jgi:CRP-like cAMP-binding protein/Fe-S-cluster-containing dehydrogenase component
VFVEARVGMPSDQVHRRDYRIAGIELWPRLHAFDLFKHFTNEQREAFLKAYAREEGMRLQRFTPGQVVCLKGEYELALCFILNGAVDLYDEVPEQGRVKVASLPAGAFYGELGALGGLPRTTDIVAAQAAEIFYLPRHTLKLVMANAEARTVLEDRYKEHALRAVANELDIFKGVAPTFIDQLIKHSDIQRYDLRGIAIVRQGEKGDAFYIVRDGYVQVVREREDGSKRVLRYLRTGEYFGEMALLGGGVRYASVLTAGKCEVIKLGGEDFHALCREHPQIESQIRKLIEARLAQEKLITPEVSAILEETGQAGVIQAEALLVMDLELCVKCDECVKACATLHGESRLIRNGIQVGKYLIPAACRHCNDPKCMNACPTGAIKRRPEGEIYFQYDMCIGCANCAIACPYDNIAMIETLKFDAAQAKKAAATGKEGFFRPYPVASHDVGDSLWSRIFKRHDQGGRERLEPSLWDRIFGRNVGPPATERGELPKTLPSEIHIPPAYPIKCDLCDGLPFMGCVHSCPTGAAVRIDPAILFDDTGAVRVGSTVRKAHGGNE